MSDFKLTPELVAQLDKVSPPPEEIATVVYDMLKERCSELDNYQLQCFAIQFLAAQSLSGEMGYATQEIKRLSSIFYYAHYIRVSEGCLQMMNPQADIGQNLNIQKSGDFNQDSTTKED